MYKYTVRTINNSQNASHNNINNNNRNNNCYCGCGQHQRAIIANNAIELTTNNNGTMYVFCIQIFVVVRIVNANSRCNNYTLFILPFDLVQNIHFITNMFAIIRCQINSISISVAAYGMTSWRYSQRQNSICIMRIGNCLMLFSQSDWLHCLPFVN